ncbi:hypothetical protein [Streptomyces minutiscleroticus]
MRVRLLNQSCQPVTVTSTVGPVLVWKESDPKDGLLGDLAYQAA